MARGGDMTRAPLPDGPSDAPEQRRQRTVKGVGAQSPTSPADGVMPQAELPGDAAVLHLVLLPVDEVGLNRAGIVNAAQPLVRVALMGVIAPAATILAAKAAKSPPALTAAVVGLELALAYLAARAPDGASSPPPAGQPLG